MVTRKDLFDFILRQVKATADKAGDKHPQAFARWFASMYFPGVEEVQVVDASGDGKVDAIVTCRRGRVVQYCVLNTKFTNVYDQASPVSFYDEITRYWQAFHNKDNRATYLSTVRPDLRSTYVRLFKRYDDGIAKLYFVTNHRRNEKQYDSVRGLDVEIFHLEDVLQHVMDYMEDAMPETAPMRLSGISNVLTPPVSDTAVPTSIVFARVVDFIDYMEEDPLDLLFARNVRLDLEDTPPNKEIVRTLRTAPKEFAYSNNGITLLCAKHRHDPGKQELELKNPRVLNGSQTLHCARRVENPSRDARVMVRIVVVPEEGSDFSANALRRREIIHSISIRSNLQNPIKTWNLISNDSYQHEVARYFRSKRLYYERRSKEWKQRKAHLAGTGIKRGPDIRRMTQLIAAYHYDTPKLGPANAYGRPNDLFDEEAYKLIRDTKPGVVYQIYLLSEFVLGSLSNLGARRQYIADFYGYINLSLFSLFCKTLRLSGLRLGDAKYDTALALLATSSTSRHDWQLKALVDFIVHDFRKARNMLRKQEGKTLSFSNYFKGPAWVGKAVERRLPSKLLRLARDIKRSLAFPETQ